MSTLITRENKGLNISLWIIQFILASIFLMTGISKLTIPIKTLETKILWVKDLSTELVRFIGAVEFLGAIGLLLPALTRIFPALTSFSAWGLALVMFFAIIFHIYRGEYYALDFPIILFLFSSFVGWGRMTKASIHSRHIS